MKNLFHKLTLSVAGWLIPTTFVMAQDLGNFENLLDAIGELVTAAIPIVSGLALLAFFFGLAKYIFQSGNEDAQDQGKQIMLAGIIGLFLIAAIGGIVALLENSFGVEGNDDIDPGGIDGLGTMISHQIGLL